MSKRIKKHQLVELPLLAELFVSPRTRAGGWFDLLLLTDSNISTF